MGDAGQKLQNTEASWAVKLRLCETVTTFSHGHPEAEPWSLGTPDVWARTVTSLARVHSSLFSAGTRPKPFSCRLGLREWARRGAGTRRCSNHTDTRPGRWHREPRRSAGVPRGRECPGGGGRCYERDAAGGAPPAYAELRRGADILAPNGGDGGSGPNAPMDRRRGSRVQEESSPGARGLSAGPGSTGSGPCSAPATPSVMIGCD
ncbi:uncharacterized protein LOC135932096 [Pelmatolapia mariae]|uniref:uncharacterized protein LOC135932096 n=1 Tax=Pelmatolapia mariae TaxID=158779 RepID=UPI003211F787